MKKTNSSTDRQTNLSKEGELSQEGYVYIAEESWSFSSSFLALFGWSYIFLLNTSIDLVGTQEHIAKIRVSKYILLKILCDVENRQNLIFRVPKRYKSTI